MKITTRLLESRRMEFRFWSSNALKFSRFSLSVFGCLFINMELVKDGYIRRICIEHQNPSKLAQFWTINRMPEPDSDLEIRNSGEWWIDVGWMADGWDRWMIIYR
ncbi:hypothetical protein RCL_jg19233.t1 [Rhizophagus clarus]|uniref:Uncharacterized protein n=1 Tax=Rhizophagus clarus TaxID=94130 RepID=A0A8H3QWZ6_9GLOM|nr:hypothetical protein RCL_jg19233.t1 [Rhizophagus clarus]